MDGSELKEWRERWGYSQDALAAELNVHVITISRWETGGRAIPPYLGLALKTIEREKGKIEK